MPVRPVKCAKKFKPVIPCFVRFPCFLGFHLGLCVTPYKANRIQLIDMLLLHFCFLASVRISLLGHPMMQVDGSDHKIFGDVEMPLLAVKRTQEFKAMLPNLVGGHGIFEIPVEADGIELVKASSRNGRLLVVFFGPVLKEGSLDDYPFAQVKMVDKKGCWNAKVTVFLAKVAQKPKHVIPVHLPFRLQLLFRSVQQLSGFGCCCEAGIGGCSFLLDLRIFWIA